MESGRMFYCWFKSTPLLCLHMNQYRTLDFSRFPEHVYHFFDIMTIYGTKIFDTHIFIVHAGNHQLFQTAFCFSDPFHKLIAALGFSMQGIINIIFDLQIFICRSDAVQILRDTTHIFRNGHIVIIQYNNKIGFQIGSVVQGLISHAAGHGTITDHGYNGMIGSRNITCFYQPQSCRNGGRAVSCIKGITITLLTFWESTHSAELTQTGETLSSSGQQLMGIRLMSHIPDYLVVRKIQKQMECHSQLHSSQIGTQMSTRHTDGLNQKLSYFLCQLPVLFRVDLLYVIGFCNLF